MLIPQTAHSSENMLFEFREVVEEVTDETAQVLLAEAHKFDPEAENGFIGIEIVMEKDEQGRPLKQHGRTLPKVFNIDVSVCMSCRICVDVCPFDAIEMDNDYELSTPHVIGVLVVRLGRDVAAHAAHSAGERARHDRIS